MEIKIGENMAKNLNALRRHGSNVGTLEEFCNSVSRGSKSVDQLTAGDLINTEYYSLITRKAGRPHVFLTPEVFDWMSTNPIIEGLRTSFRNRFERGLKGRLEFSAGYLRGLNALKYKAETYTLRGQVASLEAITANPEASKVFFHEMETHVNQFTFSSRHENLWKLIAKQINPNGARILDAGCSEGFITHQLARNLDGANMVIGLDMSLFSGRLTTARTRYVQGDIYNLALADGSVKAVVCMNVFIHLNKSGKEKALQEFERVVGEGGIVIIGTDTLRYEDSLHIFRRTSNSIILAAPRWVDPSQRTVAGAL